MPTSSDYFPGDHSFGYLETDITSTVTLITMHAAWPLDTVALLDGEYVLPTNLSPSKTLPVSWQPKRGFGTSLPAAHLKGALVFATLIDVDLYNLPIYTITNHVGSLSIDKNGTGNGAQFGFGIVITYTVSIAMEFGDFAFNGYLLTDAGTSFYDLATMGVTNYSDSDRVSRHGSGRDLDFRDGGLPVIYEQTNSIPTLTNAFNYIYGTVFNPAGTKFFLIDDPGNERVDITINAPQASQYGPISTGLYFNHHPFEIPISGDGAHSITYTPSEDNFPKQVGYVAGSYDYGWGPYAVPPPGNSSGLWLYPNPSRHGPERTGGYKVSLNPLFSFPIVKGNDSNTQTLRQSIPTDDTIFVTALFNMNIPSPDAAFPHASVYTFRVLYTPAPGTSNAQIGLMFLDVVSRRMFAIGQVTGQTTLKIWTYTTPFDDSVNSFAELDSVELNLEIRDLFLRVYLAANGAIKILYSVDNLSFFVAYAWSSVGVFFGNNIAGVGVYMKHGTTNQDGRMKVAYAHFFTDTADAGIEPTTYREPAYAFPAL